MGKLGSNYLNDFSYEKKYWKEIIIYGYRNIKKKFLIFLLILYFKK